MTKEKTKEIQERVNQMITIMNETFGFDIPKGAEIYYFKGGYLRNLQPEIALKECPTNKRMSKKLPKRWRAKKGEKYYIIGIRGDVVELTECAESGVDDLLFAFGNYFQTREKAEKARDLMEGYLNKFHEND